ncbi:hypothetical protein CF54_39845 [Streptomyces sp. Tu 6176]|uniref:hypothetical protein n=1 Tax=Streptomyces sp. Tu 6176 TaxID=1470557 RepID=UPI00044BC367|nr:hypothetical protein [Streptomyces sp. Tu 6176]EYT77978.1 hypothetical protein CF54_39845 [Streptomyces sp. Tu 6176]
MATTTVDPKARKRRRKTRTKNISPLPAIVASQLKADQINLVPGKEHVICPDCKTWTPITGVLGNPVLVPHHTTPYHDRTTTPRRCSSSNRRITLDTAVDAWQTELTERIEVSATVASRRPTKVLPKPKTSQAPAASQLKPVPLSAEQIRQAFRKHREQCLACKGEATGRDGQPLPCNDGQALAVTFLRLHRQEPKRQAVRAFFARERRRFDRQYAAAARAKRTSEWAAVLPRVAEADENRRAVPAGDAPTEGPAVPEAPWDAPAHDRRQAELGKQYAARALADSAA